MSSACGGQARHPAPATSLENPVKMLITGFLIAAVLAAPCIYDVASKEPSSLAGLFAIL